MYELLGLSSDPPTTVTLSLMTFAAHGGASGPHRDGLGIGGTDQHIALVASAPLSDEPWQPLGEGEILALTKGAEIARHPAN